MDEIINNSHCLITGATGFIGGRLVEKLGQKGATLTLPVRDFAHASRISRFKASRSMLNLSDENAVLNEMRGVDYVFHCSHDFTDEEFNLKAAVTLAKACLSANVKRMVFLSSFVVHHPFKNDTVLSESSIWEPTDWPYAQSKRAIEKELMRFHEEEKLPLVVLRPTIVYGAFCKPWTDRIINNLILGNKTLLPGDGEGLCHALYVDDLIQAMIQAAVNERANGNAFLISGPDSVTWYRFYCEFQSALNLDSHILLEQTCSKEVPNEMALDRLWKLTNLPLLKTMKKMIITALGRSKARSLRTNFIPKIQRIDGPSRDLHNSNANMDLTRAKEILGYTPAYDFNRGFSLVRDYIQWRGR